MNQHPKFRETRSADLPKSACYQIVNRFASNFAKEIAGIFRKPTFGPHGHDGQHAESSSRVQSRRCQGGSAIKHIAMILRRFEREREREREFRWHRSSAATSKHCTSTSHSHALARHREERPARLPAAARKGKGNQQPGDHKDAGDAVFPFDGFRNHRVGNHGQQRTGGNGIDRRQQLG
jgi:hypothetical protein